MRILIKTASAAACEPDAVTSLVEFAGYFKSLYLQASP